MHRLQEDKSWQLSTEQSKTISNDKPAYVICEHDKPAHPRSLDSVFVIRWPDSTLSIEAISKIQRLASLEEQAGVSLIMSQTTVDSLS